MTAVCLLTELVCRTLRLPETYTNPFFIGLRFFDFDCYHTRFLLLHQAGFFPVHADIQLNYLAPAIVVYAIFYAAGTSASLNVFLAFISACVVMVASRFALALHRRSLCTSTPIRLNTSFCFVAAIVALAFPWWFLFQRANLEIIGTLLLAGGLSAFLKDRSYTAAALFGLAASVKILPIVYLGLFLSRRQYRQIIFGLLVALATIWLAMAWVGPTVPIAARGLSSGMAQFRVDYILSFDPNAIGFDHALLGLYRRFHTLTPAFPAIVSRYTIATMLAALILFFARVLRLPFLNQLLFLTMVSVWLVPVSFEYTLVQLYLPFGVLALAVAVVEQNRRSLFTAPLLLIAVLVSPLSEFILHGLRFGGQIKSLVLLALFTLTLYRPLRSTFDPATTATL